MSVGSMVSLDTPWVQAALGLVILLLISLLLQWLARGLFTRVLAPVRRQADPRIASVLLDPRVLRRAAQIVPSLVVQAGLRFVPELSDRAVALLHNVAAAVTVLCIARLLFKMLDVALDVHAQRHRDDAAARAKSIKAWVQLTQLLVVLASVVIMIAALTGTSPLIVLSGFGALSAVLMLVFQDTIRSFVAGVLVERNDMLRLGDWMEMPQAGADGNVIDIALNTVKVQNWDKTIVTIPTWRLMIESFKNWRGMQESGGRRIKRSLMIDAGTVRFLDDADVQRLRGVALISGYLAEKTQAVQATREQRQRELGPELAQLPANQRRLTNIGTFRHYVVAYLRAHAGVHPGMTQMVRQLQPSAQGVPLEIYCFTATTAWVEYEGIQSDIFDHLMAILPEFGLRAFQNPSDAGLQQALARGLGSPASGGTGAAVRGM